MSIELLIAPPAAGKTEACIHRLRVACAENRLSHIRVIVPDRLQAINFRRRLAAAGGAIGVHAGTFGDLYKSILEQTGNYVPIAPAPLLHRLIQETVDNAVKEMQISHYGAIQSFPGFILSLRDAFAELKRSLVFPEQFTDYARKESLAQQELAYLYLMYQARLHDLGWADQEGLSWLAVEALETYPSVAASIQLLIVDGFDSFTGAQLRTLQLLGGQVVKLLITFPGEVDSKRVVHRRFTNTIEKLCQQLSPQITGVDTSSFLPPDILHLESQLFQPQGKDKETPVSAFLLETRSPADEAREVLRWIKMLAVRDDISVTDCAIFTPDPDIYNPLLSAVAAEFGIPAHFTRGEPLTSSPAIIALINLLTLPAQNFKTRGLFNVIRSPYFGFSFERKTIDILEHVSRVARIIEGREQWNETWERLAPTGVQATPDIDDERILPGLPRGTEAKLLCDLLNKFFIRVIPPNSLHSLTGWINWLEDLLEAFGFYERADNEGDMIACEAFNQALRAMVLSESVMGAHETDYAQFLSELQGTLEGMSIAEQALPGQPGLLIGRMAEARGVRYKAVALLGLSEGLFPEVERADPFLDEKVRAALGLDPRLQREQLGLFYQAVTRADQYLLITRPYLSDDGENWEASPFWKATLNLFDASAIRRIQPEQPCLLVDACSSQELLFWAVRRGGLPKKYFELQGRWQTLQHARDVLKALRIKTEVGIQQESVNEIRPLISERYSADETWSASRLETYGTCPYMFYIKVALQLEPTDQPELGLDASQVGSMLHKILEEIYRQAEDPTDAESVLSRLQKTAEKVFATAPELYGFRPSPLWDVEQEQFIKMLSTTVRAFSADIQDWTPFAFEQTFGFQGNPPLEVDLGTEVLLLHGIIDRLDRDVQGHIRVVDYKTGSSHLDQRSLIEGRRLQLPLYALAARDTLKLGEPIDGLYWMIQAAEAGPLRLASFKREGTQGLDIAIQVAKEHLLRIITGIRAAEFPQNSPKGGCPSYCPAAQWCWRYVSGW